MIRRKCPACGVRAIPVLANTWRPIGFRPRLTCGHCEARFRMALPCQLLFDLFGMTVLTFIGIAALAYPFFWVGIPMALALGLVDRGMREWFRRLKPVQDPPKK